MKTKRKQKAKQIPCPRCRSTQTYVRIRSRELVCTGCAEISPLDKIKAAA